MRPNPSETSSVQGRSVCRFCKAELLDGASFCTHCGNVIGAEFEVGNWDEAEKSPAAKSPTTVVQKFALVLVVAAILYGVYVIWGGKNFSSALDGDVSLEAAAADVSNAEKRVEDLKKAIANEDAKRIASEREKAERFHRNQEEARRLRLELNGK